MADWTLKFASYQKPDDIFDKVVSREKTIETRSYDPHDPKNYSKVQPGDTLIFLSLDSGRIVRKTAKFMHKYSSVKEMAKNEPVEKIFPGIETSEELIEVFKKAKQKWGKKYAQNLEKHGIIALGFE